ncbi:unnamed protein product, partial [Durusdinium trenchii]
FVWEDSQADGLADHVCPEAVIIVVDPEPDPAVAHENKKRKLTADIMSQEK